MTNRIEQLCKEFDEWTKALGMPFARLGLAKRLAEAEAENARLRNLLKEVENFAYCKVCEGSGYVSDQGEAIDCPNCNTANGGEEE